MIPTVEYFLLQWELFYIAFFCFVDIKLNLFKKGVNFMATEKVKGSLLWSFCKELVDAGAGYVWGGYGKVYNNAHMKALYNSYKTSKYDWTYYSVTQWKRWANKIVVDCSGMIQAFRTKYCPGKDDTANGLYQKCSVKGTIDTLPKNKQGVLVFVETKSTKSMNHVGVYGGNGTTIESKDSATGVCNKNLDSRWTHWGIPDWIEPTTITSAKIIGGGIVTASALNVRKGPSTKYQSAYTIKKGITVPIYEKFGIWRKISNTEELWVSGSYLEIVDSYTVTANALNVRNKPNMNGKVVNVLRTNDIVFDFKPKGSTSTWIKIDPDEEKWISGNTKYIKKNE